MEKRIPQTADRTDLPDRKFFRELSGDRLILREIAPGDLAITGCWLADPNLREALVIGKYPMTEADRTAWFEKYRQDPSRMVYIARLKETLRPIGQVGFNRIEPGHRNAEMHIFIGLQKHRGRGYGREMLELFLDLSFHALKLNKIWLKVNRDNRRAIRFYRKMGFTREGVLRRHELFEGRFLDKVIYSKFSPIEVENGQT